MAVCSLDAFASLVDGKEVLHAWLDMEPAVAFCDDSVHCLSSDDHSQAPHVSNLSVPLQHDMIQDAGGAEDVPTGHWIRSVAFLLLCVPDLPVCSFDQAWRFGCTNPPLLAPEDNPLRNELNAECLLFWAVLGLVGLTVAPFASLASTPRRLHVLLLSSHVDNPLS